MRKNRFGDSYCHTAAEALSRIDPAGGLSACYVDEDYIQGPDIGVEWTAEVLESGNGNIVCYIEAPKKSAVLAIITELGLEIV